MLNCASCGAELQHGWKACPTCGNRVDSGQAASHRPAPIRGETAPAAGDEAPTLIPNWGCWVIIVVFVVFVVFIGYAMWKSYEEHEAGKDIFKGKSVDETYQTLTEQYGVSPKGAVDLSQAVAGVAPAAAATAAKPAAKAEAPTQTYYMLDLLREKHSNVFVFNNKYDGSSLWVSGGTISRIGDCGLDFGDDDMTKACVSVQVPLESVLPVIKIGEDYLYIGGVTCRLRSQSDVLSLRVGNSVLVEGLYVPSNFSHEFYLKDCTVTVF